MANLAVIPARGGSKRIPRKNIKDFLGRPIIAYSIETALNSGLFDEVMVSTDDEEIAEISESYGAKVPFLRSVKNSGDYVGTTDVIKEVLELYNQNQREFNSVCCLYPTAPLCQFSHLKMGFEKLIQGNFDAVFPIAPFNNSVFRGLVLKEGDEIEMLFPQYSTTRSQDLEKAYYDAGQWYWIKVERISSLAFARNQGAVVLSENEVQDIDTLSDWILAEMKYRLNNE